MMSIMPLVNDQAASSNTKSKNLRSSRQVSTESVGLSLSQPKFPRIEDCAHFHYDSVDHGCIKLSFVEESSCKTNVNLISIGEEFNFTFTVRITCKKNSWLVRRNLSHFQTLDLWLHQCVFDRKYSHLPVLTAGHLKNKPHQEVRTELSKYLVQLSNITDCNTSGWQIFCAPVLHWLEIDKNGRNLVTHALGDVADINIPAVAAARVVRRYQSQHEDELTLNVGDMVSIIEMTTGGWWRGKQGLKVGSFPSLCVKRINCATDIDGTHQRAFSPPKHEDEEMPISQKHGKFMLLMRSFLDTRPSKALLKKKGIFRERVFGCDLGELLHRTGEEVPSVVEECARFVEKHGVVDGIYRISGVASHIRHLKYEFDSDRRPDLERMEGLPELSSAYDRTEVEDSSMCDPHSVAGLCKLFFRELPNPLLTYQLYNRFASAVTDYEAEERLLKVHDVIQQLPPPHYRTLKYLINHLRRMAENDKRTSMHCRNLAIVWAPNLLRSREIEAGLAAFTEARVQSVVTEFLIVNGDLLFSEKLQTMQYDAVNKPLRPRSLMILPAPKLISLEEAQARSKSGIVSPVLLDSSSPTQVSMREWSEKTSGDRRKRRQKKSTSISMVYGSNSPHPVRSSRKQGLPQTHSVYDPNFNLTKLNELNLESPSSGKQAGSQSWKLKLGNLLKKSSPATPVAVSKKPSLRRTKSDDSLISSHSAQKHSRNSDPLIECNKTLSQPPEPQEILPPSDRGAPEPQAPPPANTQRHSTPPVRMRNKSHSPKKRRAMSRPSGVIYTEADPAPVKRRETFQITFRKVTPPKSNPDDVGSSPGVKTPLTFDTLSASNVSPDKEPSPNSFAELSCDFPDIMGEDGLDFDPLNYRSSRDQFWPDVVVPPYKAGSEETTAAHIPTRSRVQSNPVFPMRDRGVGQQSRGVAVKRVDSVKSLRGDSVFAAVSTVLPSTASVDERDEEKSNSREDEKGNIDRNEECKKNERGVGKKTSHSLETDFNPETREQATANVNYNNNLSPQGNLKGYIVDPAAPSLTQTSRHASGNAFNNRRSLKSYFDIQKKTEKGHRLSTKETTRHEFEPPRKLTPLYQSSKAVEHSKGGVSPTISVQVYDVPEHNQLRRDAHYGSFIALVCSNTESQPQKPTSPDPSSPAFFNASPSSSSFVPPLTDVRNRQMGANKSVANRLASAPEVYSPRLGTFNPEGKQRSDYQEAILSPRYRNDLEDDAFSRASESASDARGRLWSNSCEFDSHKASSDNSLPGGQKQNLPHQCFEAKSPKPAPHHHARSYSAGDDLLDQHPFRFSRPTPFPRACAPAPAPRLSRKGRHSVGGALDNMTYEVWKHARSYSDDLSLTSHAYEARVELSAHQHELSQVETLQRYAVP